MSNLAEERETDGVLEIAVSGKEQPFTYAVAAAIGPQHPQWWTAQIVKLL
jgi:hypothetical protein